MQTVTIEKLLEVEDKYNGIPLTFLQIAEEVGCTQKTICNIYHSAIQKLQKRFSGEKYNFHYPSEKITNVEKMEELGFQKFSRDFQKKMVAHHEPFAHSFRHDIKLKRQCL